MNVNKLNQNKNVYYIDLTSVYSIRINVSLLLILEFMIAIILIKYQKISVDNTNQFVHFLLQTLNVLKFIS